MDADAPNAVMQPTLPVNAPQVPQITFVDALGFLDRIKAEYRDTPNVYDAFLDLMRRFRTEAIDARGVMDQVVVLFRGHNDLIQHMNVFFPAGYYFEVTPGGIAIHTPTGVAIVDAAV